MEQVNTIDLFVFENMRAIQYNLLFTSAVFSIEIDFSTVFLKPKLDLSLSTVSPWKTAGVTFGMHETEQKFDIFNEFDKINASKIIT